MKKPINSYQMKVSNPIIMEMIQMNRVLQVSTVDLCGALAYLVTATPHALKEAMDAMIPKLYKMRTG